MNRIIAFSLLMGWSSVAMAADAGLPMEVAPVGYDWSGGYAGVFVGWGHSRTTATDITGEEFGDNTPGAALGLTDDGFVGGITAGYNFQNGSWVFGPELELGWASNDKTYIDPTDDDDGVYTEYGFFGAITGRVGYAANRTLFYAKGGIAFADMKNAGGEFDGVGDEDPMAFGASTAMRPGSGTKFGLDGPLGPASSTQLRISGRSKANTCSPTSVRRPMAMLMATCRSHLNSTTSSTL